MTIIKIWVLKLPKYLNNQIRIFYWYHIKSLPNRNVKG